MVCNDLGVNHIYIHWFDSDSYLCALQLIFVPIILLISILFIIKSVMDLYSLALNNAPNFYMMASESDYAIDSFDDFLLSEEPVWILGRKYSALHELEELHKDITSRIWITYRKNFASIGGTGPTSDTGWGCMLRCGQMVMAQAIINKHLTRDWLWTANDTLQSNLQYREVLKLFADKKSSTYSIHQIAQMGVCEGKSIGQWFGPNTIAQVLKKLSAYDQCNNIAIHVALDNMVIIDDIKKLCKEAPILCPNALNDGTSLWKPLILFIPLRLGLSEINPIYFKSLKATFILKQSLGIIGGRPNHALYFIGAVEDQLVYLDPHKTQETVDLDVTEADDSSYHCERASRMDISLIDPSLALCFYCDTEAEFDNWCQLIRKLGLLNEKQSLFELTKEKPAHWTDYEFEHREDMCATNSSASAESFTILEDNQVSDDEFELL